MDFAPMAWMAGPCAPMAWIKRLRISSFFSFLSCVMMTFIVLLGSSPSCPSVQLAARRWSVSALFSCLETKAARDEADLPILPMMEMAKLATPRSISSIRFGSNRSGTVGSFNNNKAWTALCLTFASLSDAQAVISFTTPDPSPSDSRISKAAHLMMGCWWPKRPGKTSMTASFREINACFAAVFASSSPGFAQKFRKSNCRRMSSLRATLRKSLCCCNLNLWGTFSFGIQQCNQHVGIWQCIRRSHAAQSNNQQLSLFGVFSFQLFSDQVSAKEVPNFLTWPLQPAAHVSMDHPSGAGWDQPLDNTTRPSSTAGHAVPLLSPGHADFLRHLWRASHAPELQQRLPHQLSPGEPMRWMPLHALAPDREGFAWIPTKHQWTSMNINESMDWISCVAWLHVPKQVVSKRCRTQLSTPCKTFSAVRAHWLELDNACHFRESMGLWGFGPKRLPWKQGNPQEYH